jgi:hypothetical protein
MTFLPSENNIWKCLCLLHEEMLFVFFFFFFFVFVSPISNLLLKNLTCHFSLSGFEREKRTRCSKLSRKLKAVKAPILFLRISF